MHSIVIAFLRGELTSLILSFNLSLSENMYYGNW